uniref:Hedgehog protein Hint domain-containing protein n=1 Tax=Physcomitrium patens TaxID=3218 RepID=A0A2K1IBE3_PHYPA|nr:hypothetical protein PHYPA_030070 [Physcomitrium patens]
MIRMLLPLAFLLVLTHQAGVLVGAQLAISVTTFGPPHADGTPNTFIGTGSQIASSLLGSTTKALMWGVVSSSDVNAVCDQIVSTGALTFSATLTATTGETETLQQTITHVGGCRAAADGSGTQAVMVDNNGRQSAVVCPNNAGSTGCGIYLTGPDVTALYNQGARRRLLARNLLARKLLQGDNCQTGAAKGALTGAITSMEACIPFLGPLYPFCMAGVIGVATAGGAAVGCAEANGCFPGTELHPSIAQLLARWTFSTGVMDPDARLDQPALTAYVGIRAFRTPSLTLRALAGDATVLLAGGEVKPMTSLALGDKVAVRRHDGGLDYEDIYAFGHKDALAAANYVQLSLKPVGANMSDPALESTKLELTPLHFTVILSGTSWSPLVRSSTLANLPWIAIIMKFFIPCLAIASEKPWSEITYKRAQDVRVGDMMWAQASTHAAELSPYLVTDISTVEKQGLYNPFTLGGTIIVNGVAASAHSEWFLDGAFDALGLTHWIPSAYQMVLAPMRLAYYGLGKQAYLDLYLRLDALVDVAQFGTKFGGPVVTAAAGLGSSIIAALLIFKSSRPKTA